MNGIPKNYANSSGRKPKDGDLAMFWNLGQGFLVCIPWEGILLRTSKIYLTKVLSQKQRGDVLSVLDPQQLPWFTSQRCPMNEEWQQCSSGEAANDKRKWMTQGREPEYKGRHYHSCNTQSWMPLTGCGHLWGTTGVWFKAWWRKGPRHNTGLFVILTSRRKRGQLDHKRLMFCQLDSCSNC